MNMIYRKGENAELRMKLAKKGGLESVTIVYTNKSELPELERMARERVEAWKEMRKVVEVEYGNE